MRYRFPTVSMFLAAGRRLSLDIKISGGSGAVRVYQFDRTPNDSSCDEFYGEFAGVVISACDGLRELLPVEQFSIVKPLVDPLVLSCSEANRGKLLMGGKTLSLLASLSLLLNQMVND